MTDILEHPNMPWQIRDIAEWAAKQTAHEEQCWYAGVLDAALAVRDDPQALDRIRRRARDRWLRPVLIEE